MTPSEGILPSSYSWKQGELSCEGVSLTALASSYGTPLYVYSERAIRESFQAFAHAAVGEAVQICFAVKANPNLAILQRLAQLGAGFDIVSGGELERVLRAGADPKQIVFSGVGKTREELSRAMRTGVGCINVESVSELRRLSSLAVEQGCRQRISLRVNPDINPQTHPYISTGLKENKFGLDISQAREFYRLAASLGALDIHGVDCHIGSQITTLEPFEEALERLLVLVDQLEADGHSIHHLDLGGGLGICYHDERPPSPQMLLRSLISRVRAWALAQGRPMPSLTFEFGRAIVGSAGVLLSRVETLKPGVDGSKGFAVVDAAMNDLMRPALYEAWHEVLPVRPRTNISPEMWDIVGPVCESGDWLARGRSLALCEDDLLVLASAGAYGSSMASQYNSRPRLAEVMVREDGRVALIRSREQFEDLIRCERLLDSDE